MLKDITLGQFFPGNSVIHRLDPRTKLVFTVAFIVMLFITRSFVAYGLLLLFLASAIAVSGVSLRAIFRGLKPLTIIVIITGLLNLFYTDGRVIFSLWILTVTVEGVKSALLMILRIMMLVTCTFLMTYTTSPISLTDGIERLLEPLKRIKVPVHEFAMMMSIALRFVPTLIEEADKIMSAQKARGADFESGGLIKRAKALIPLLIPLFVNAFRRADELATAMECRCYRGGEGRTRMKVLKYTHLDYIAYAVAVMLLAAVIVIKVLGL